MITTISKWGNSQGVRISSDILRSIGYSTGDEVYVKRHISDKEMENTWQKAAAEKWDEKNR